MKQIKSNFDFANTNDARKYLDIYKSIPDNIRLDKFKFQMMRFFLAPYLQDGKVVDLGCGEAFYSKWIAEQGVQEYLGIDLSSLLIEQAKEKYGEIPNLKFITGDFLNLKKFLPDSKYDVFLSIYSLMRLEDSFPLFKEVYEFLKPDGIFLVMSNTYKVNIKSDKNIVVKIKKNDKIFLNNYPRTLEEYVKITSDVNFELVGYYSQPFSKNKIIENSADFNSIEGFDSLLLFKKAM